VEEYLARANSFEALLAEETGMEFATLLQTRRQVLQLELIGKTAPQEFLRAERVYRDVLLKIKSRDIPTARELAKEAVYAYRQAMLHFLKSGPIRVAREQLSNKGRKLTREQRTIAKGFLANLETALHVNEGVEFNIRGVTEFVFSQLAILDQILIDPSRLSGEFEGGQACPKEVQPEIFSAVISTPVPKDLLVRGEIFYVAGGELDITLLVSACSTVVKVFFIQPRAVSGTIEFETEATTSDSIEGSIENPYYYTVLGREAVDEERWREHIRLHFPNRGEGRTYLARIHVESIKGTLANDFEFTLVEVAEVQPQAVISLSANELRNGFIAGIYQDFGDDGVRVEHQDGEEKRTLKDPAYEDLEFRITEDGINFSWNVKVIIPGFCDPTIYMAGRFHLDRSGNNINVVWDDGPRVNIEVPLLCKLPLAILDPILVFFGGYIHNLVEEKVRDVVQQQVNQLTRNLAGIVILINTFQYRTDELRIALSVGELPRVAIDVPYGRLRLEEAFLYGMALNPDERVLILASGLTAVCSTEGSPLECQIKTGPAGLFNWDANVPVPTPWRISEFGTVAYFEERHKAWKALEGVRRNLSRLPFPEENAVALVGRLANEAFTSRYRYLGASCLITTRSSGEDRLVFGANDYRYVGAREFGSGFWRVTIVWVQTGSIGSSGRCPESDELSDLIDGAFAETLENSVLTDI